MVPADARAVVPDVDRRAGRTRILGFGWAGSDRLFAGAPPAAVIEEMLPRVFDPLALFSTFGELLREPVCYR